MSEYIPVSRAEGRREKANGERRRAVRFECQRRNSWRLFATTTCSSGQGTVNDISVSGISLSVDSALRPGMFLDLSLASPDGEGFSQPMLVRVRRVTPQADGSWLVGCKFVKKLTEEELRAWL
jgi:PilZ domain